MAASGHFGENRLPHVMGISYGPLGVWTLSCISRLILTAKNGFQRGSSAGDQA